MFIKLLTDDEANFCYKAINKDTFDTGDKTQPLSHDEKHKSVKQNMESRSVPGEVRKLIMDKIYDSHYIDSVYCPTRVSVNFYNKYETDDYYDTHIDNFKAYPKSNNVFFDYGFSINLQDNYEGGEMYFHTEMGVIGKRLNIGEAVIFPIFYPHGVQKITKGTRINILGWISSNISYEKHFILKNLFEIHQHLIKEDDRSIFTKSVLIQNYLKKAWGK